jgi:D-arginine dehydrogenase
MQDVLIIGGGMAGASAAFFLASGRRVTVLEAEAHCGMHTTGRSAALFIEGYGNAAIRAFTRASRQFFLEPPSGFCDVPLLTPRGAMLIGTEAQRPRLEALVAERAAESATAMEWLDPDASRSVIPILRPDYKASAFLDRSAMDIDVDALHQGFLRGARRQGAQVVTNARVEAIERVGDKWIVTTPVGVFDAPVLVDAAGAWADQVAAMAGATPLGLVPKRRTAMLVEAPPSVNAKDWPGVIDVDEMFYFKPSSGMLLLSPADETPSEPCDAQPDEIDIAVAVDRIQQAADLPVTRISRRWAGLRSFLADKTPAVGWDTQIEGFFWLAGQGGYGIQTGPALGQLTAALVTGSELPQPFLGEDADPGFSRTRTDLNDCRGAHVAGYDPSIALLSHAHAAGADDCAVAPPWRTQPLRQARRLHGHGARRQQDAQARISRRRGLGFWRRHAGDGWRRAVQPLPSDRSGRGTAWIALRAGLVAQHAGLRPHGKCSARSNVRGRVAFRVGRFNSGDRT